MKAKLLDNGYDSSKSQWCDYTSDLTVGKIYEVIEETDMGYRIKSDIGSSVCPIKTRFEVVKELTMEDHIENAREFLNKVVITPNHSKFTPTEIIVFIKGFPNGKASILVEDALKTNLYVVALWGDGYCVPYEKAELVKDEVTVKLNDKYNAVVTKNDITVGCQTFPVSIVEELNKAINSLQ